MEQSERAERRQALSKHFTEWKVDAFLVSALPNVRYLTGFTGSNGNVLITSNRAILLTDPRYQAQAAQEADCEVNIVKGPLVAEVTSTSKRLHLKKLGIEQNRISYEAYLQLSAALPKVRLKPVTGGVEALRTIKSATEIASIRASVQLNSAALEAALKQFKPEMLEADLAAEIDFRMRRLGADGTAFDTIVASGERTALPHAHPSERAIGSNELLLIDMGALVAGYCSDMTRTHAVGKLTSKNRRLYRAVLESQLAAIDAVKPGATSNSVDRAARIVLRGYGLERAFVHSTGHGLGLEIHEGPRVGRKDKTKLEPGMVITIEPGAYVEGAGGVRIEDTVLVTGNGYEVLTPTSKELRVL